MNLVSFEYVACQEEHHGVLVLSEFAGAASFMREGSIPFHPANTTEMSEAIYRALNLDEEERKNKYEYLRDFVNTHTRYVWFFLDATTASPTDHSWTVQNGAKHSPISCHSVASVRETHADRMGIVKDHLKLQVSSSRNAYYCCLK